MGNWRRDFTFTVALPPQSAEALNERASAIGVDVQTYVAKLVDHLANAMVREKESKLPELVVFDADVCMQRLRDKGSSSAACMKKIETGSVRPVVSEGMFEIMRSVAEFYTTVPRARLEDLITYLRARGEFVEKVVEHYVHPHDENASYLANLAIARGTDSITIVSHDPSLTDLSDVNGHMGGRFTTRHPSCRIVTPEVFLKEREGGEPKPEKATCCPTVQRDLAHALDVARRETQVNLREQELSRSQIHDRGRGRER